MKKNIDKTIGSAVNERLDAAVAEHDTLAATLALPRIRRTSY